MKFLRRIHQISVSHLGVKDGDFDRFTDRERAVLMSGLTDDQCRQKFFPDVTRRSFEQFRFKLLDKAYDLILRTAPRKSTPYQRVYLRHIKELAVVKTLLRIGARKPATALATKIMHRALKYAFTGMIMDLARILMNHHLRFDRNKSKADKYFDLFNEYHRHQRNELMAERAYGEVIYYYSTKKHSNPKIVRVIEQHMSNIRVMHKETQTVLFSLLMHLMEYVHAMSQHRVDDALHATEEALDYFQGLPFDHSIAKVMFKNMQVQCLLLKGELDLAMDLLAETERTPNGKNLTWANNKEMLIRVLAANGKYTLARQVITELKKWSKSVAGNAETSNRAKLYEVYLGFAENQINARMLKTITTELPHFSQDAKAMDASVLIAEIVYHTMHDRSCSFILMWHDKIELYIKRHMRSPKSRARVFLKLLLNLHRLKYDVVQYHRMCTKLLNTLSNIPRDLSDDAEEIEIVPYEQLWGIVCDSVGHEVKNNKLTPVA